MTEIETDGPVVVDINECANKLCQNNSDSGAMTLVHVPLKNSFRHALLILCRPCARAMQERLGGFGESS